ncbi:MAG: hypothetical protein ABI763_12225 [Bacteroidota bacterium]
MASENPNPDLEEIIKENVRKLITELKASYPNLYRNVGAPNVRKTITGLFLLKRGRRKLY